MHNKLQTQRIINILFCSVFLKISSVLFYGDFQYNFPFNWIFGFYLISDSPLQLCYKPFYLIRLTTYICTSLSLVLFKLPNILFHIKFHPTRLLNYSVLASFNLVGTNYL